MTQEEIIKLAHTAGFNWPDIQATTIEQRLERFASLVAATEREKFTNTQEFVTLPREVVEQALEAMTAAMGAGPYKHRCSDAEEALRAALEQPQNHVPDAGNMVPAGWKLVPVEPTVEMLRAGCGSESPAMFRESLRRETDGQKTVEMVEKIIQRNLNSYRAMLAAAPQPQTTEQSSAVEQPQVEREPVAGVVIRDGLPCLLQDRHIKSTDHRVYTHPQPAQKPLTDDQVLKAVRHLYQSDLPVGMGFSDDLDVARAVLEAAPQPQTTEQSSAVEQPQVEREPVAWIWTELSSRKLTFDGPPAVPSVRDELTKPVWTPLYTRPQREREPLTDMQKMMCWSRATHDADVLHKTEHQCLMDYASEIEAAHNIK